VRKGIWRAMAPALMVAAVVTLDAQRPTPSSVADELRAADLAFAAAASRTTVVPGLTPMFAADVIMPAPPGTLAKGREAVVAALAANPDNATGRLSWAPVRVGLSADGRHGFTFGFMTLTKGDGSVVPLKYMTYWVKGAEGWRAAAYKRARRPDGAPDTAMMPPALPASLVPAVAVSEAARQGLMDAEQEFSDRAQVVGLGPAFAEFGLPDAVNMGGPANVNYVVGAKAIAALVGQGQPEKGSSVSWSCETCIVTSSGDLGVSIGYIRSNANAQAPSSPFFTIWRKVGGVWKYIAE
jgi:ketosteroid isomerase-like protein